jgi:hypothetical protein
MTHEEMVRQATTDAANLTDIRNRMEAMRAELVEDWDFHAAVGFQLGGICEQLLDSMYELDAAARSLRSTAAFVETSHRYVKRFGPYLAISDTP